MICYEAEFITKELVANILEDKLKKSEGRRYEIIEEFNKKIAEIVPEHYRMYCISATDKRLKFAIAAGLKASSKNQISTLVKVCIEKILDIKGSIECNQITIETFRKNLNEACQNSYIQEPFHRLNDRFHFDIFNNNTYRVDQYIISEDKFDEKKARAYAARMLSDSSFTEELDRIYSSVNPQEFLGHPVHYKIDCSNIEAGIKTAELLVKALFSRRRLCGGRIDKISNITRNCYEEQDFTHLVENAEGNTVVIDLRGEEDITASNYASAYEEVVNFYNELIRKNCRNVLFIFLYNTEHPGFGKSMISSVQEYLNIVDINEGYGDRDQARIFIEYLVRNGELSKYEYAAREYIQLTEKYYTASDLYKLYNKWSFQCLKKTVYAAYADYAANWIEPKAGKTERKLEDLVGLDNVKSIVQQIIATNVIDKRRLTATTRSHPSSKHMIFTGNPGSAKTTVARILAQVLKEEGVLDTGNFVECGRGDLVGKYVGWTAPTVKKKFRQARGGILFIDEAYSLVDGQGGSFGDEAINTIVQEMENHRDDVIVIFAGYPEKMKEFLDRNEGLRSRIAFHVDFPDYNADELMQIMDVMLADREYKLTDDARDRAFSLLEEGCRIEEFGNGRFVRNVIEQAIMKQSLRLYKEYKGRKDIPKKKLLTLDASDFELESVIPKKEKKLTMGFRAS